MTRSKLRRAAASLTVLALALAACGGDEDDGGDVVATVVPSPADSGAPAGGGSSDAPTEATSDAPSGGSSDAPSGGSSSAPLSGDPYEGPPIGAGATDGLAVIGVAADDVLNVRSGPGTAAAVVAELDPLETGISATGEGRLLPNSIWVQLDIDGTTGWASAAFLGFPGDTVDITAEVTSDHGETPAAETMLDLARIVAETRASEEPESRIVISDGPTVGDLGEITVDVVGLGDDAVLAERLVVFGQPDDSGDGFSLESVEMTVFCGRGEYTTGCP